MREIRPGGEGVGVRGSGDLLDGGEQGRVLVAGRGRVTRLPGDAGEIRPGGEGGGVRGSGDLLKDGAQGHELVAGRGRVTRRPGEAGEIRPGGEGGGVPGSKRLIESGFPALPAFHLIHGPREGSPLKAVDHVGALAPGPQVVGFGA
jgi:hypothetical protein